MKHPFWLSIILLLTACATQSYYIPETIDASGPYTLESNGLVFQESVAEFNRSDITQFNESATNLGVSYQHKDKPINLTVYSHLAGKLATEDSAADGTELSSNTLFLSLFDQNKQSIFSRYKNSELVAEREYLLQQEDTLYIGRFASFQFTQNFAGSVQPVVSHLYMFQIEESIVKYRITWPVQLNAEQDVHRFLNSFSLNTLSH